MLTDDDLRAVLRSVAPTPTCPAPDTASLATRVGRLSRRRLLGRGSGVLAVIALLAVGVPSLGAFQRDEGVALRGGAPSPGRAPAVDGPVDVVAFQSLGPRAALDLEPGSARQVVGEELVLLDETLERDFAGQPDALGSGDVALAIAPLRCTPRIAHLRLDGTRLLAHTQEGGCVDGGEGDVGVDTVVLDRASLPGRFEVVIDPHEGGPGGSVPSVIELTPDAPPEPGPPRDVPLRGVALLPGERSGLVDGDDLELILVEGATAPEEGEVVLAVSARACDLAVRGATLHGRVLTVTADALPGPAADGAEATCPPLTAFIAVPGAQLPKRFTLVAEFRSSSDGAHGVQLGEPVDVVLQPLERLRGAALDYLTVELGDGSGMPLASARQIVGEDLVALDARSAASYVGPDDLVTANDVVLELLPPSCTQIGGLSLVGDTLLARVGVGQDGLTGQPCPEGPVPVLDRVVIERALLPTRFDVVFVGDEPIEGLPTQPVPIVLADDAPPATAPPRDVPFRVLGTGPGEVQVGLAADHAQLQRDGVAPPQPGEVVLGIPVDGCVPSFSSARHFDGKLQISGASDFSNTACPGLTTTTYVAVARGELPPRFVLRAELRDETDPNSSTGTLVGPIAIDLGPP